MAEGQTCYENDEAFCEDQMCLRTGCRIKNAATKPLTYEDFYRNLDGLTALATAAATPLRKRLGEKDTELVKRIVATYLSLAAKNGVHC